MKFPPHIDFTKSEKTETKDLIYAFIGNPNAGKTTLFNHLTGLRQKVANYSGVTVEKKAGICYSQHGKPMQIIDLPGSHSLSAQSPDEAILKNVLLGRIPDEKKPNRIVFIADASQLHRHLYLLSQAAELGLPMILALNMTDVSKKLGLEFDIAHLEKILGIPVVITEGHKNKGTIALKVAMSKPHIPNPIWNIELPSEVSEAIQNIQNVFTDLSEQNLKTISGRALTLLMEGIDTLYDSPEICQAVQENQKNLDKNLPNWRSIVIQARHTAINQLCEQVITKKNTNVQLFSEKIDSAILHPIWGWGFFALIMGLMFWSIFSLAEYPKSFIENTFDLVYNKLNNFLLPGAIKGLMLDGILIGVGNIIAFLPQILMLFFFIGLLESVGYLPRAAFLLDKVMRKVGLQGKSFIPLLSSFACAIPGIMATRTIASRQERLATLLVAPWMSCSARLPVYLLMIGALFPHHGASSFLKGVFLLTIYALGILAAFIVAWVFRKTFLRGKSSTSFIELPYYRFPSIRNTLYEMFERAWIFLKNAGTVILCLSIVLWFLVSYPKINLNNYPDSTQIEHSYAGKLGKIIEPAISPIGFDWRIGIGMIASFAAREVFVSTMAILYNAETEDSEHLTETLHRQRKSDGSLVYTPLTCLSILLFFLLAMQCMSTVAVVKRETNSWRWPIFQFLFMTFCAYATSFVVYQGGLLLNLN